MLGFYNKSSEKLALESQFNVWRR